jgi:hypothetical protein
MKLPGDCNRCGGWKFRETAIRSDRILLRSVVSGFEKDSL